MERKHIKKQNAFDCKHFNKENQYCKKIRHDITNGYAIECHCSNCKYFKKIKEKL